MSVGFVYSDVYLRHKPPQGHPESADRLSYLVQHLGECGLRELLHSIQPTAAEMEDLHAIHSEEHVAFIRRAVERGGGMVDEGDTHVSAGSYEAAILAAGGVCRGVDAALDGSADAVFCAVRPPGHHAERDRPMGFCLFNNVAVGARYAQRKHGIERVAILDWDVHHGNGTQHAFEDDPSVLFISLHQYPFYPGSGARGEKGVGRGEGFTVNIPMMAGSGEPEYIAAFQTTVVPKLKEYSPGLLIISAGFDAHRDDPLADMNLTENSFARMTRMIEGIAPTVSVLEGGYNHKATALSVEAHLRALARRSDVDR
jgi:acetoin utilization deacetylase AcuC-like enzyme